MVGEIRLTEISQALKNVKIKIILQVQERGNFLSEAPKGLRVVYYVKFTQESKNLFLMIIQVGLRHDILVQSEVRP